MQIPEKKDRFGLGYQPSKATKKDKGQCPPTLEIFINKGVDHGGLVSMISNKSNNKGASNFIREFLPDEELKNWTAVEIPEIFFFPKYFFVLFVYWQLILSAMPKALKTLIV